MSSAFNFDARNTHILMILIRLLCLVVLSLSCIPVHAQNNAYQLLQPVAPAPAKLDAIRSIGNDAFRAISYTGSNGISVQCRVLEPPPGNSSEHYPLIVVFHGSGASGTDNKSQLGLMAKYWAQEHIRRRYPAYVLAVQFPTRSSDYTADPERGIHVSYPQPCVETAMQLVDSFCRHAAVDRQRVYGLGYSMGASTVLNAAGRHPSLFAAVVAISGVPEFSHTKALARIPLLLIHGNADHENEFAGSARLYKELSARKKNKVLFREIDGAAHDMSGLWLSEVIPSWLFAQQKK